MKHLLPSLAVLAVLAAASPAQALEGAAIGYGGGVSLEGQWDSTWSFRATPWGAWSEATLRLIGRSQSIAPAQTYAIDSTGLAVSLGGRLPWVYGGLTAELDSIRKLTNVPGSSNLTYQYGPGFLLEPYLGVVLPFLNTDFTQLDLDLSYPLLSPDPAFGPRLNLTLWIGGIGQKGPAPKTQKPGSKAKPTDDGDDQPVKPAVQHL